MTERRHQVTNSDRAIATVRREIESTTAQQDGMGRCGRPGVRRHQGRGLRPPVCWPDWDVSLVDDDMSPGVLLGSNVQYSIIIVG